MLYVAFSLSIPRFFVVAFIAPNGPSNSFGENFSPFPALSPASLRRRSENGAPFFFERKKNFSTNLHSI
jgi:hypothetical protein